MGYKNNKEVRNKVVSVRLTKSEADVLNEKIKASGKKKGEYLHKKVLS